MNFRHFIIWSAWVTGVMTVAAAMLYRALDRGALLTLAITTGTICYHFTMRLCVGWLVPRLAKHPTGESLWFRTLPFEAPLYRALRVKCWKDRVPTYQPEQFSLQLHSLEELMSATCVAELVHETIIPLSFAPLAASRIWGSFGVFLLTSLGAGLVDLVFVILQRYNRPRLRRLLAWQRGAGQYNIR